MIENVLFSPCSELYPKNSGNCLNIVNSLDCYTIQDFRRFERFSWLTYSYPLSYPFRAILSRSDKSHSYPLQSSQETQGLPLLCCVFTTVLFWHHAFLAFLDWATLAIFLPEGQWDFFFKVPSRILNHQHRFKIECIAEGTKIK